MNLIKQTWTKKDYTEFIKYLKNTKEDEYAKFTQKLTPTKYSILGIRVPKMRYIAKEIGKGNKEQFLKAVTSKYYEEVFIEGLIIDNLENFDLIDKFLPKIDNWAICDSFKMKWIDKNLDLYFKKILEYLKSDSEFTVRFGLVNLLNHYIKDKYLPIIFHNLDNLKSEKYYINMAIAWLLCECYTKYSDLTEKYLLKTKINDWTFNKTISKIKESYRISKDRKEYLNTLKRKKIKI